MRWWNNDKQRNWNDKWFDNEKKFIIKGGRTNHLYYRLKKTFKKKGATIQNMHIYDFFPSIKEYLILHNMPLPALYDQLLSPVLKSLMQITTKKHTVHCTCALSIWKKQCLTIVTLQELLPLEEINACKRYPVQIWYTLYMSMYDITTSK